MNLKRILLAHGGGGRLTRDLIKGKFLPALHNRYLEPLSDSAVLPELPRGRLAFTTDAFVVDPIVFPGGDLGYLSVCGTLNDLAVAGARPLWISWALILEEGLDEEVLDIVVKGARKAALESNVDIVAGDTKVVPKGKGDKAFAVTSGVGVIAPGVELFDQAVVEGDAILVSGPIGDHGAAIMAVRQGLTGDMRSDVAPVWPLVNVLLEAGLEIRVLHDPTRGGVATVCHEVAEKTGLSMILEEKELPVRSSVRAISDLLGLDPLYMACEGRFLAWVAEKHAQKAIDVLRSHPMGRDGAIIGWVSRRPPGGSPVILRTRFGTERPLDLLTGLELPRIC